MFSSKVFNKNEKKDDEEESSDEEHELRTRTVRFKENNFVSSNLSWDAVNGEFKMKRTDGHFVKTQESEDEMDDYASYRNLDADYVAYLKRLRREKRREKNNDEKCDDESEPVPADVPLTPNIGLASVTNTNVLVNDTLERMKHSLNKINSQLIDKKGTAFEGQELEDLHLQLSQTEYQMAKILQIVNTASDSFNTSIRPLYPTAGVNMENSESSCSEDEMAAPEQDVDDSESEPDSDRDEFINKESATNYTKNCLASNSSSASISSVSSSTFNTHSSSDEVSVSASVKVAQSAATVGQQRPKEPKVLSEEGLRKRRLKKKINRKKAKINKKNKNKNTQSKKED